MADNQETCDSPTDEAYPYDPPELVGYTRSGRPVRRPGKIRIEDSSIEKLSKEDIEFIFENNDSTIDEKYEEDENDTGSDLEGFVVDDEESISDDDKEYQPDEESEADEDESDDNEDLTDEDELDDEDLTDSSDLEDECKKDIPSEHSNTSVSSEECLETKEVVVDHDDETTCKDDETACKDDETACKDDETTCKDDETTCKDDKTMTSFRPKKVKRTREETDDDEECVPKKMYKTSGKKWDTSML
jgi:hypothetical protein